MQLRQNGQPVCSIFVSVANQYTTRFWVDKKVYDDFVSGDLFTYTLEAQGDRPRATLVEKFERRTIGYQRDLCVSSYDAKNGIVHFENGADLDVHESVYEWQGRMINLEKYRKVVTKVVKEETGWSDGVIDHILAIFKHYLKIIKHIYNR